MITPTAKASLRQVFEDKGSFASAMLIACTDLFGSIEWFNWEPESLVAELRDRCSVRLPKRNSDKIQALVMALTTDQFYRSVEAFMGVCNALDGDGTDFTTFDPADVEEMAWAVMEVSLNDQVEGNLADNFSDEIKTYIGVEAEREGFAELPKPLKFGIMNKGYGNAAESMGGDDIMFAAYFAGGKEEVARVEAITQAKLQLLVTQISQLPLQHGDPEAWRKFSGRGLALIGKPRPQETAPSI